MEKVKDSLINIKWGLQRVWEINKKNVIWWSIISILGAFLPAVFISLIKNTVTAVENHIRNQNDFSVIVRLIVTLCFFQFIYALYKNIPMLTRYSMHAKYAVGMQKKMGVFMRYIPIRFFDDPEIGAKIASAQPTMKRLAYFLSTFVNLISNTISIISLFYLAAVESMIFLIMGFALVSISIPVGICNSIQEHKFWKAEQKNNRLEQYYYGLAFSKDVSKEYRLFGLDSLIRKNWLNVINPLLDKETAIKNKSALRWNINEIINLFLKASIIFLSLYLIYTDRLSIGGVVLFITLFDQLSSQALDYGQIVSRVYRLTKDLGFQRELFEGDYSEKPPYVSDESVRMPNKDDGPTSVFELKNVSYQYIPGKYALRNINLNIKKGEIVALVGSNGSGKSTLVKLLLGLYTPTEGQLFYKGKNYADIDFSEFVKQMGVTFQDFVNFDFSIRENIAYGDISQINNDEAIMDAVKKGGAKKIINRLPDGIDTLTGKWYKDKGVDLSGGEWQRIAVCRALISNREILVLDEPASMLDPIAEMEQFNSVRSTIDERTAILISHRIGFARLADKIVVLDEGSLIEYGTHEELIEKKGVYYKMFVGQAEWYQKEKNA